jgi:hypothetical protein
MTKKWKNDPFDGIEIYFGPRGHLCISQDRPDAEQIVIIPPEYFHWLLDSITEAVALAEGDAPGGPRP